MRHDEIPIVGRRKAETIKGWIETPALDKGEFTAEDGRKGYFIITGRWNSRTTIGITIAARVQILGGHTYIGRAHVKSDGRAWFGGLTTRWSGVGQDVFGSKKKKKKQ